jgi:hypothetical protein
MDVMPKAQVTKAEWDKWGHINLENFCVAENNQQKEKQHQPYIW